jgi:hypothetical protein
MGLLVIDNDFKQSYIITKQLQFRGGIGQLLLFSIFKVKPKMIE